MVDNPHGRRSFIALLAAGATGLAGCHRSADDGGADERSTVTSGSAATPPATPAGTPTATPGTGTGADLAGYPMFQQDAANTGHNPGESGPGGATFGWRFGAGAAIHSSPAVADGTVYVGSQDGSLYALSADRGTVEWSVETGGGFSSPAVAGNTVYVGGEDTNLYALDAATGEERWAFPTDGPIHSSPTLHDGTVYVGSFDGNVYALDAAIGEERWRFPTDNIITSTPAVGDGAVFVGGHDERLWAIEDDGTERWRLSTQAAEFSSPAVMGETVYFASHNRQVYALDAATGEERWWFFADAGMVASPVVFEGTVYAQSVDRTMYALDTRDGSLEWNTRTGGIFSSPAAVDDAVYIAAASGEVHALSPEDGSIRWSYEVGTDMRSSPAVTGGALYVGAADAGLYAVGDVGPEAASLVDVRLSGAPDGLQKYTIAVEATEGTIVDVDPELLSGTAFWVERGGRGEASVAATGIALDDTVAFEDTRTLFTVGYTAGLAPADVSHAVETLRNDAGEPMDPSRVEVGIRTPAA